MRLILKYMFTWKLHNMAVYCHGYGHVRSLHFPFMNLHTWFFELYFLGLASLNQLIFLFSTFLLKKLGWHIITREKTFRKKGDIGIREKAHKQDTSQTQQPHSTIVTSAPTSPFQHKSTLNHYISHSKHASLPTTPLPSETEK